MAKAADYPMIRLFTAALEESPKPVEELLGISEPWSVASPSEQLYPIRLSVCYLTPLLTLEAVNGTGYFSAVCWLYGRNLFDYLKYPIGIYRLYTYSSHYYSKYCIILLIS